MKKYSEFITIDPFLVLIFLYGRQKVNTVVRKKKMSR